ncbi:hypothetical protein PM082_022618 [Marasmius tenuissimus]|nr:hypothetical protein PM082_022618 [Marasmius tenuissimus]
MLRYDGFSAWITVDDKPLGEYDVRVEEETKVVTCWIASEAGKPYKIHWHNEEFRSPTMGRVRVDGHECGGKGTRTEESNHPLYMEGLYVTETSCRPFTFSNVKVSDEDGLLSDPTVADIGLIQIKIENVWVVRTGLAWKGNPVPVAKTFHEKTKKMITHQTSFDQPAITIRKRTEARTESLGPPVVTFQFRYRPLAILQAQGIASRPPLQSISPSPPHDSSIRIPQKRTRCKAESDSDGELVAESDDEGDENARKLADLERQLEALRKQINKDRPRKKVKREPIVGVTIDLTED